MTPRVLQGVLTRDPPPPQRCVVWGKIPHLWSLVSPALSLEVVAGFGSPSYQHFLRCCHPGLRVKDRAPPRRVRRYKDVKVVMMDAALVGLVAPTYWSEH